MFTNVTGWLQRDLILKAADGLAMRELQWWRDQEAALSETNITDALHEPSQSQQEAHHTGCPGLPTACARTAASPAYPPTTPRLPLSKIRAYQVSSRKSTQCQGPPSHLKREWKAIRQAMSGLLIWPLQGGARSAAVSLRSRRPSPAAGS